MALYQEKIYTIKDIYALPEGRRAELIDGQIYDMAPPAREHQKIVAQLIRIIGNYIEAKNGDCEVYPAPFAVFKYRSAGVREYWIINPRTRVVNVFDFEHDQESAQYSFDDKIPVCIYSDLTIGISDLI